MANKGSDIRPIVKLRSTAGTGFTYVTRKNRRNDPDRMVLRKGSRGRVAPSRASSQCAHRKAEEGAVAEPRRLTTTPRGACWGGAQQASPAGAIPLYDPVVRRHVEFKEER